MNPDDIFKDDCDIRVGYRSIKEMTEVLVFHDALEEASIFKLHAIVDNGGDVT